MSHLNISCAYFQLGGVESFEYGVLALQMIDDKISKEPMTLGSEEMMPVCLAFKKLVSGYISYFLHFFFFLVLIFIMIIWKFVYLASIDYQIDVELQKY